MESKFIIWAIIIFGVITFIPLLVAQLLVLRNPNDKRTKDILIGKGEDWRDNTHYKSARAFAWADWIILFPLLVFGSIGVILSETWGYLLWISAGFISIYFSILCWVLEKEYTYPSRGPLIYYSYYWGFFLYWGIVAIFYSMYMLL